MEIRKDITVDDLTKESVSVKVQRVYAEGQSEFTLGDPVRTAYTKDDIDELKGNVPEPYLSAILDVWGVSEQKETEEDDHE